MKKKMSTPNGGMRFPLALLRRVGLVLDGPAPEQVHFTRADRVVTSWGLLVTAVLSAGVGAAVFGALAFVGLGTFYVQAAATLVIGVAMFLLGRELTGSTRKDGPVVAWGWLFVGDADGQPIDTIQGPPRRVFAALARAIKVELDSADAWVSGSGLEAAHDAAARNPEFPALATQPDRRTVRVKVQVAPRAKAVFYVTQRSATES